MSTIQNILDGLIEFHETEDVNELIDALGIVLIKKDLTDDIKGKFFRDCWGTEYIVVDSGLEYHEERYILAHELGHAVLHTDLTAEYMYSVNQVQNKYEIQADKFAAALLLSGIDLNNYITEGMTLSELSKILKLPERVISYKIKTHSLAI